MDFLKTKSYYRVFCGKLELVITSVVSAMHILHRWVVKYMVAPPTVQVKVFAKRGSWFSLLQIRPAKPAHQQFFPAFQ